MIFWGKESYAQYTFDRTISTEEHDFPGYLIEKNDGGFILSGVHLGDNNSKYTTNFVELSATGEVIQTQSLSDTSYSYFPIYMQTITDTIHVLGYCIDDSDNGFLWRCKLSNSLEMITQQIYFEGPNRIEAVTSVKEISNNQWVMTGYEHLSYGGNGIAAIINRKGELIRHETYPVAISHFPSAVMEYEDGGFLLKKNVGGFVLVDDELEIDTTISYNSINPDISHSAPSTMKALNNSTFLMSGRYINDGAFESDIAINKIENLNGLTAEYTIYRDTAGVPALINSLDFKYNDKIYCGGWQLNPPTSADYHPYFSEHPGWFILTQFDEDLTPNWTRFYGGDAYYSMTGILATNDGGCLMYGRRYDASSDTGQDIYLLKVGPDGLLTSTTTPENTPNITVYPNPTSNYIFLDTGKAGMYNVSFFDGLGKVIFQGKTPNNRPVDVRHLPTGVYTYVLEREGEVVSQGKWMKE